MNLSRAVKLTKFCPRRQITCSALSPLTASCTFSVSYRLKFRRHFPALILLTDARLTTWRSVHFLSFDRKRSIEWFVKIVFYCLTSSGVKQAWNSAKRTNKIRNKIKLQSFSADNSSPKPLDWSICHLHICKTIIKSKYEMLMNKNFETKAMSANFFSYRMRFTNQKYSFYKMLNRLSA